jgi:hypothetical protein
MKYASGRYAKAICDICGCECDYRDLRTQVRNGRSSGLQVCPDCQDEDPPKPPKAVSDAQALKNPRPDLSLEASRRILHWKPTDSVPVLLRLGSVTIGITLPGEAEFPSMVLLVGAFEVRAI